MLQVTQSQIVLEALREQTEQNMTNFKMTVTTHGFLNPALYT